MVSRFAKEEEKTEVELTNDLTNVELTKDGTKTKYKVGNQMLSGFGSTVPNEVSTALNISDLNIQKQLDQHFLITESPGEVARVINEIIRIEKADAIVSSFTTKINALSHQIEALEDQKRNTTNKVDDLKYLDGLQQRLESWEKIENEINDVTLEMEKIEYLFRESLVEAGNIGRLKTDCDNLSEMIDHLNDWIIAIKEREKEMVLFQELLKYQDIEEKQKEVDQLLELVLSVSNEIESIKTTAKTEDRLREYGQSITETNTKIAYYVGGAKQMETKIQEIVDRYISFLKEKGFCPICKRPFTKDCTTELRKILL
jgi:hypothetical protein